jgi:DsbC/DsbD-like thiol-disulfide interchange protein
MLVILAFVMLLAAPVQRPTDVVKWTAEGPQAAVSPDRRTVHVKVRADIQPGWKLYAIQQPEGGPKPLAFGTSDDSPFKVSTQHIIAPRAKVLKQDENFAVDTHYYESSAAFTIPVAIDRSAAIGTHEIPLDVTFQACGNELCLRPFTQKIPVTVSIAK